MDSSDSLLNGLNAIARLCSFLGVLLLGALVAAQARELRALCYRVSAP